MNECAPDCPGVATALAMADRVVGDESPAASSAYERTPQTTTLGVGTVEVLPVLEFIFGNEALTEGQPQIVIPDEGEPAYWSGDGEIKVIPGLNVRPGQFVVHWKAQR